MSRPVPMCLPDRMAWMKSSSVHTPRTPVFGSGVRFAAKEIPQGPLHAVRWSLAAIVHGVPGQEEAVLRLRRRPCRTSVSGLSSPLRPQLGRATVSSVVRAMLPGAESGVPCD